MTAPKTQLTMRAAGDGTTPPCSAADREPLPKVDDSIEKVTSADDTDERGLIPPCLTVMEDTNLGRMGMETPLGLAMLGNHTDIVKLLITNGANVDFIIARSDGMTPLGLAVRNHSVDTAEALITAGANVNLRDGNGMTPLCWAAREEHIDIAELLIQHGADINKTDDRGWSPLRWAEYTASLSVASSTDATCEQDSVK